jgi:amidase
VTSDELIKVSAARLAELIGQRVVSPIEVVEAYLRRIESLNPQLNAIVSVNAQALDRAREAETELRRGCEVGVLHGVPLTIKDTIETQGLKTTSGSLLRAQHVAGEDALAVARLKSAGAIILGKTNVPEMAIPYECDNPVFGRTNNPHDRGRTSGGSSGGEAAAISACLSPAGLGSDLSGSIRVPAHFCGLFGLKPSAGRVPSSGHFPPATGPLSHGAALGPMARHVEDLTLLFRVMTLNAFGGTLAPTALRGRRAALCLFKRDGAVTEETLGAMQSVRHALRAAGLEVVEETPPGLERAASLWPALFSPASVSQLRSTYRGREEEAGPAVRAVLASAEKTPPPSFAEFAAAWEERERLRAGLIEWMNTTPLLIAPVGAAHAFEHGARRIEAGGEVLSIFRAFGYARSANVLGLPAISVPAGRSREGLPIGVQIIGQPFAEGVVLAAASIIEAALGGWVRPPDAFR